MKAKKTDGEYTAELAKLSTREMQNRHFLIALNLYRGATLALFLDVFVF
jgi:hypothetical protein